MKLLINIITATLLFAASLLAGTHVTGTLFNADGSHQSGYVVVSWRTTVTGDSRIIGAAEKRFPVVNGALDLTLEPGQYAVRYYVGTGRIENWLVPVSSSTINLATVITLTTPAPYLMINPNQILPSGATTGQGMCFDGSIWAPGDCGGGSSSTGPAGPTGATGATGAAGADGSPTTWGGLTDKPSTFPPAPHAASHATGQSDAIAPSAIGAEPTISAGTSLKVWRGDKTWVVLDTSITPENGNLYFTTARARAAVSASSPIAYDSSTGIFSCPTCGTSSGGIASLHGLTATTQLFSKTDDTNVTLTLGTSGVDTHTFTLGWTGALAKARQHANTLYSDGTYTDPAWITLTAAGGRISGFSLTSHTHTGVYEPVITGGTTAQYFRGDKSLATFATDALAAVTWSTLTGKPSTFTPALHAAAHATGQPDAITPAAIGAQAAGSYQATITGAPGTWPSTWAWASLSGVPSTFAPVNTGNWAGTWQTYAPSYFQTAITTGTTAQYFRGDLSLATFPTTWAWASLSGVPSTFAPITSGDWAGTWQTHAPSYFQTALTAYSTISGLSGYPSTFAPVNTGNWAGTWQTYSPSYFQTAITGAPGTWPSTFTPTAHASSHKNGGSDEVATATPGANAIPKAGSGGTLAAGWLPSAAVLTIASGTATLGTGAIAANACASAVTVTATGAFPGVAACTSSGTPHACCTGSGTGTGCPADRISWTPNADISGVTGYGAASTDGLIIYPYVTPGNMNFKVCNATGLSITPGAVTLNCGVVR